MKKVVLIFFSIGLVLDGIASVLRNSEDTSYELQEAELIDKSLMNMIDSILYQLDNSDCSYKQEAEFWINSAFDKDQVLQIEAYYPEEPAVTSSRFFFRYKNHNFFVALKGKFLDRFFRFTGKMKLWVIPSKKDVILDDSIPIVDINDDSNPVWMAIYRNNQFSLLTDWFFGQMQWRDNENVESYKKLVFGIP